MEEIATLKAEIKRQYDFIEELQNSRTQLVEKLAELQDTSIQQDIKKDLGDGGGDSSKKESWTSLLE